jgi:hypothetical protein
MTIDWSDPWGVRPLYYWYYTTQAKFLAGGRAWDRWEADFARELVAAQQIVSAHGEDGRELGYWVSPGSKEKYGEVYSTALCTLMLEVYYRYLGTYGKAEAAPRGEIATAPDDAVEIAVSAL